MIPSLPTSSPLITRLPSPAQVGQLLRMLATDIANIRKTQVYSLLTDGFLTAATLALTLTITQDQAVLQEAM